METVLIKALQLIIALSLLIVLHEGGHFLFAKLSNSHKWDFSLSFENSFARFLCLKCAMEISAQKLEKVLLFLLSE